MKTAVRAAVACSLALQTLGATILIDSNCHNAVDVATVVSTTVVPSTCGTGLVPVTATISGTILKPVSNATLQIVGYVDSVPFLSLKEPLCDALLNKGGPLSPTIELLSNKLIQPVAGGALKDVSTGKPLGINGVAPNALLTPVSGLLSGLLGGLTGAPSGTGGATGGLPVVGDLLGALNGLPLVGGLLGGLTGSSSGAAGGLPLVGDLLGTLNGLPLVGGLLGGLSGASGSAAGGLPVVGDLLKSVTDSLNVPPAEKVPTQGGLINGAVVPLLETVTQLVSGLPVLGPLLVPVLGTVSQLVVTVLNLVITLLQGLPVVGNVLTSVQVQCADGSIFTVCPVLKGDVTLKVNLNLPVPKLPVFVQAPKISFFVRLFVEDATEVVCSKMTVAM